MVRQSETCRNPALAVNQAAFALGASLPTRLTATSLLKKGTGTSHTPPFRELCIVAPEPVPFFNRLLARPSKNHWCIRIGMA